MVRWLVLFVSLLFSQLAWAGGININTASVTELDTLPGIGPSKAEAIIAYRAANGPFANIADIIRVPGIGDSTYANIQALITVGEGEEATGATGGGETTGSTPPPAPSGPAVDINTATQAQLETLPGIGPTKAAAILADRQANGPFASCTALTRVKGIGEATVTSLGASCTASAPQ